MIKIISISLILLLGACGDPFETDETGAPKRPTQDSVPVKQPKSTPAPKKVENPRPFNNGEILKFKVSGTIGMPIAYWKTNDDVWMFNVRVIENGELNVIKSVRHYELERIEDDKN